MQGKGEPCGPRPSTFIVRVAPGPQWGASAPLGRPALKKAKIASPPIPTTKRIEHRSRAAGSGGRTMLSCPLKSRTCWFPIRRRHNGVLNYQPVWVVAPKLFSFFQSFRILRIARIVNQARDSEGFSVWCECNAVVVAWCDCTAVAAYCEPPFYWLRTMTR